MRRKLVYLDSNILIGICDGKRADIQSCIEQMLVQGGYLFPFSAEQVSEITSVKKPLQNELRLSYLRQVSQNQYFVNSINEFGFKEESPDEVYKTLNEVHMPISVDRLFANFVNFEQQQQGREALGLDPIRLNNLNGKEAVKVINKAIDKSVPEGVDAPRTMKEIAETVKNIFREQFKGQWSQLGQTEESALKDFEIISLFSMLDSFGYWADDPKTYDKGSRFPDSRHVFNASHFNVLVTDDKKMRNRAIAVYEVLGIETRVFSTSEFQKLAYGSRRQ